MQRVMLRICICFVAVFSAAAVPATASQLVDRGTARERLTVRGGVARVVYRDGRVPRCVLYRGAVDALTKPPRATPLALDRTCGWKPGWPDGKRRWKGKCGAFRGPKGLPHVVAACTAPDGSHWLLQRWARETPNYGGIPEAQRPELRISHFTGKVASFSVYPNWSWRGRFLHIVATLQYDGQPWYAINFKPNGYVTDGIGRNVAIDSYDSDMGPGWRRVNAVLTHRGSGQLCFGFSPKTLPDGTRSATGYSAANRYRLTVAGPGVSPDVRADFSGVRIEDYDPLVDAITNALITQLIGTWTGPHNCQRVN